MRKFISGGLLIILPCIVLYFISCTPGSCFEETESYLKASFYNYQTGVIITTDSISLRGLNSDSLIYNKNTGLHPALFPLNASTDSSIFIITIKDISDKDISDTIKFIYTSYSHLISKECGYTFYHHLESEPVFTTHFIKEITIKNKTITNLNVENLRILY
jgi:hypothetical protein